MNETESMDLIGRAVVDRITQFTGVVTGVVFYISGCNQALVAPAVDEKGLQREPQWFDVQRLAVKPEERIVLDNSATPGCDAPAPKR